MRIQDGYPKTIDAGTSAIARAGNQAHRHHTPSTGSGDDDGVTVNVSDRAKELAAAAAEPPVDNDKVERLKSAIDSGKFEIDSDRIADRIVGRDAP